MKYSTKIIVLVMIVLFLILNISVFVTFNKNRNIVLDDVRLRESSNSIKSGLAIMLEQSDGTYSESDSTSWPTTGYSFNAERSGCIDENGNEVTNALSYNSTTNLVNVRTQGSTYCYLYFDLIPKLSELCSSGDNLGSCLTTNNSEIYSLNDNVEGGLYRYQGTNDTVTDNYVCFGTTDSSECMSNTDAYMYRIIGVTEDNQLKLIKKEALNTTYAWNSSTEVTWAESELYTNLNGSYFYSNTTYVPTSWQSKIAEFSWKYGSITTYNTTASAVYTIENRWTSTTSAKIGLMYMHDYYYAYQSGGLNCSSSGDWGTCKTAWLHLSVNDSGAPSTHEWTMSRYDSTVAWLVYGSGYASRPNMIYAYSVRPVFYLNADEVYKSGDGTIDNPIMLSEPPAPIGESILVNPSGGLNTTLEGGLYRYQGTNDTVNNYVCFGYSDAESDCDFTNTTNSDLYAYRIIGINESGQLKLIKNTSIGTMAWDSSESVSSWVDSDVYSKINSYSYLTNTTYVPSGWSDKIATTSWKYGILTAGAESGTAETIYSYENGLGYTVSSKIALMYVHDFVFSHQSGGLVCTYYSNYGLCKDSWLFLGSNEWTMAFRETTADNRARYISTNGLFEEGNVTYTYSVRPVFFLNADVVFVSGTGASTDPFIVK